MRGTQALLSTSIDNWLDTFTGKIPSEHRPLPDIRWLWKFDRERTTEEMVEEQDKLDDTRDCGERIEQGWLWKDGRKVEDLD
jgi:hypothetical protein